MSCKNSEERLGKISIIVPGGINTDIVGLGVQDIISKGELSFGGELNIGAGGKSRNIAQMISVLTGPDRVAMVGKTSKDPYGLWKPPIDALNENGVNTDFIKLLDFENTKKYPGIALIPVDKKGNNQIYVLPGINDEFCAKDIDDSLVLFESARKNKGILAMSLELPLDTAIYSLKRAREYGLKTVLDPGGIIKGVDYDKLLDEDIFLIKPNEHESKILTGIYIENFDSAKAASERLLDKNIKNVLITAGKDGAYFFNDNVQEHIPIPKVADTGYWDETGCGDQVTAALCALLIEGYELTDAVNYAVAAGTLKFHKPGIQPVTKDDLKKYMM